MTPRAAVGKCPRNITTIQRRHPGLLEGKLKLRIAHAGQEPRLAAAREISRIRGEAGGGVEGVMKFQCGHHRLAPFTSCIGFPKNLVEALVKIAAPLPVEE